MTDPKDLTYRIEIIQEDILEEIAELQTVSKMLATKPSDYENLSTDKLLYLINLLYHYCFLEKYDSPKLKDYILSETETETPIGFINGKWEGEHTENLSPLDGDRNWYGFSTSTHYEYDYPLKARREQAAFDCLGLLQIAVPIWEKRTGQIYWGSF